MTRSRDIVATRGVKGELQFSEIGTFNDNLLVGESFCVKFVMYVKPLIKLHNTVRAPEFVISFKLSDMK